MKQFKHPFFLCLFLINITFAAEKKLDLTNLKWPQELKKVGIEKVNICGTPDIQISLQSLKQDFFSGRNQKGYLFSNLISNDEYWRILKTQNLIQGKEEIQKAFSTTILWEISEDGEVKNLGRPIEVQTPFKATVKDCVEGAKKTLGGSCSDHKLEYREFCCSEKFVGPKLIWKSSNGNFVLNYSPDPSIRLKVPGEKSNRFCHSLETLIF